MKLVDRILKIDVIRNISLLVTGTVLAQLFPMLLEPFLKRIYLPEDFGKLSLFLKSFNTLVILSTCCYEMGIIINKDEEDTKILINGNILLNMIFLFLIESLIIILLYFKIIPKDYYFFILLPFSVCFYSIGLSFNNYMIRKEKYKKVSLNKFIRRMSEAFFQINTKLFFNMSIGLIIGNIFGNFCYFIYNFKVSKFKINIDFHEIKRIWKKYIEFPKYNLFPQLFNTLSSSVFDFFVLLKFSISEVGYLELTQKVLLLPSALLSDSIGRVILQSTSKKINNKESIKKEILYTFIILLLMGITFFIIVYFYGVYLFALVFGSNWLKSGIYAKWMIFYICISFIASPLSSILLSLKKFKINSFWQICKTLLILLIGIFSFKDMKDLIIIYTLINSVFYIIYMIIIFYELYKYENNIVVRSYNVKKK